MRTLEKEVVEGRTRIFFLGGAVALLEGEQDVKLVRWPAEFEKREKYHELGVLRLLVVEGGAQAPICTDIREDWIRAPITHSDLIARMQALRAKTVDHCSPRVDRGGIIHYGAQSAAVSPTEADLLELLTFNFGVLVPRETLRDRLSIQPGAASRNALDLHIMRIRRRIAPLGLVIQTAWGRGYVLTVENNDMARASNQ